MGMLLMGIALAIIAPLGFVGLLMLKLWWRIQLMNDAAPHAR